MYAEYCPISTRLAPLPPPHEATDLEAHRLALESSSWSVRDLARRLPAIQQLAGQLAPEERTAWIIGLHHAWRRHGWALPAAAQRSMLELAAAWCDWTLALAVGETLGDKLQAYDALLLIEAQLHLGEIAAAHTLALRWQLASPHDQRFAAAWEELRRHEHFRQSWAAIDGSEWGEPDLRLEPLAHHHLDDFAWQYFDPAIAELCCLPDFRAGNDNWHAWLTSLYATGDELPLAVLHREYGFVGCSHLVLHEGVGFLYYWLGPDFRGQGVALRANRLLLEATQEHFGMRTCYAKVFEENVDSRRLLEHLKFEELGMGAGPNGEEVFYRRGQEIESSGAVEELRWLLARMKSETSLAARESVFIHD